VTVQHSRAPPLGQTGGGIHMCTLSSALCFAARATRFGLHNSPSQHSLCGCSFISAGSVVQWRTLAAIQFAFCGCGISAGICCFSRLALNAMQGLTHLIGFSNFSDDSQHCPNVSRFSRLWLYFHSPTTHPGLETQCCSQAFKEKVFSVSPDAMALFAL
jgi:hypothetical protein